MKGLLKIWFLASWVILAVSSSVVFAQEGAVGKIIGISGTIEFLSGTAEPVAEAKPGDVKRVAFEKWEKVKFHQPVFAKDKFRTARKSRLKILLIDNSLIALGPNSEVNVKSYLFDSKDKLRQGVIGVAHGLSMYIINKSQTNKKSKFRIVTPTANIAARGTQGFNSVSPDNTFTANKVGEVDTSNSNPSIPGVVPLGPLMGNNVRKGQPPTPATPLSEKTIQQIGTLVLGLTKQTSGQQSGSGNPLIEVQTTEEEGGDEESEKFQQSFLSQSEGLAELFEAVNNPFSVTHVEGCKK